MVHGAWAEVPVQLINREFVPHLPPWRQRHGIRAAVRIADKFFFQAAVRLLSQSVINAGQNNHHPVSGVSGLGDRGRIVSGFSALHKPDHQPPYIRGV